MRACPGCGAACGTATRLCPQCGAALNPQRPLCAWRVVGGTALFVVGVWLALIGGCGALEQPAPGVALCLVGALCCLVAGWLVSAALRGFGADERAER